MARLATGGGPAGRRSRRASAAEAARKIKRDIDRLEASINKFRVDAQRFFAGDLPLPPDELRDRILTQLRRLRSSNLQGAAENFRLGSLEARFNSHLDLFGRRLRQRETAGRVKAEEPRRLDPVKGVVIGREAAPAAAEALFKGLYPGDPGTPKPKMDLGRFRAYLDRQAEVIRKKTGCAEIQFRIAVEEGKMKLKAKPIRRPA